MTRFPLDGFWIAFIPCAAEIPDMGAFVLIYVLT